MALLTMSFSAKEVRERQVYRNSWILHPPQGVQDIAFRAAGGRAHRHHRALHRCQSIYIHRHDILRRGFCANTFKAAGGRTYRHHMLSTGALASISISQEGLVRGTSKFTAGASVSSSPTSRFLSAASIAARSTRYFSSRVTPAGEYFQTRLSGTSALETIVDN